MKRILKFNDIYALQKDYVDHYQTRLSVVNINNLDNHAIFTIDPDAITVFFRGIDIRLGYYLYDFSNGNSDYINIDTLECSIIINNKNPGLNIEKITVDNLLIPLSTVGDIIYNCPDDYIIHCLQIWGNFEEDESDVYSYLNNLGQIGGSTRAPIGLFVLSDLPLRSIVILPKCLKYSIAKSTANWRNFNNYTDEDAYLSIHDYLDDPNITEALMIEDFGLEWGEYAWRILQLYRQEIGGLSYTEICPNIYITADELPELLDNGTFKNCNIYFTNCDVAAESMDVTRWLNLNVQYEMSLILPRKSIIAIYDVDTITEPTYIFHGDAYMIQNGLDYNVYDENFIKINGSNGVLSPTYTFSTVGEHTIYVYPTGDKIMSTLMFEVSNANYSPARLRTVIIPDNIVLLNAESIYSNYLNMIIFKGTTPPTLSRNAIIANCPIYVPDSAVDAYKTASEYWIALADKIKPISELTA